MIKGGYKFCLGDSLKALLRRRGISNNLQGFSSCVRARGGASSRGRAVWVGRGV